MTNESEFERDGFLMGDEELEDEEAEKDGKDEDEEELSEENF